MKQALYRTSCFPRRLVSRCVIDVIVLECYATVKVVSVTQQSQSRVLKGCCCYGLERPGGDFWDLIYKAQFRVGICFWTNTRGLCTRRGIRIWLEGREEELRDGPCLACSRHCTDDTDWSIRERTTMPTILPLEASYRTELYSLALVSAIAVRLLLMSAPLTRYSLIRIVSTLVLPTLTFSVLQHRQITLTRALALRISHSATTYRNVIAHKTILAPNGMSTILTMLLSTSLLSNLPLVHQRLTKTAPMAAWSINAAAAVEWFFAAVNLTVVAMCCVMIITQEEVKVEFDDAVQDVEVALHRLSTVKSAEIQDEWVKMASTSRRHDVWVKPVRLPNGDSVGVFDMTTRLASNHPLYNPDTPHKPSGPTLRISLP